MSETVMNKKIVHSTKCVTEMTIDETKVIEETITD